MINRRISRAFSKGIDEHTLLLLQGEGSFTDSSLYAVSTSKTGTVTIENGGVFGKAIYYNGGYLSTAFSVGTGNFTIDFWIYKTISAAAYATVFASAADNVSGGMYVNFDTTAKRIRFISTTSPAFVATIDSVDFPKATWTHCAFVREGTSLKYYKNGTLVSSGTLPSGLNFSVTSFKIGAHIDGTLNIKSLIDEFRVSKVARWSGNFTPPTAPYSR